MEKKILCSGAFFFFILSGTISAFSFKDIVNNVKMQVKSLFNKTRSEIIQQDIVCTTQKTILVENISGSITIKSGWHQKTVSVTATKKASAESIVKIVVAFDSKPDIISMKTIYQDKDTQGTVDYTLIVPEDMTLRLLTAHGNIKVKHFKGELIANTQQGSIMVSNISNKVVASVAESGSIIIDKAMADVHAMTQHGDITIHGSHQSVTANAQAGTITMHADKVDPTSRIALSASGPLQLWLPENTNAHVQLNAGTGSITSKHPITLAPQTTQLDSKIWKKLQRSIQGTMGTGEADIVLTSAKGTIKILAFKQPVTNGIS